MKIRVVPSKAVDLETVPQADAHYTLRIAVRGGHVVDHSDSRQVSGIGSGRFLEDADDIDVGTLRKEIVGASRKLVVLRSPGRPGGRRDAAAFRIVVGNARNQ